MRHRIHLAADSSVPLTHHFPRDLELICLVKKCKIRFRIIFDLKMKSWIFLKKPKHLKAKPCSRIHHTLRFYTRAHRVTLPGEAGEVAQTLMANIRSEQLYFFRPVEAYFVLL